MSAFVNDMVAALIAYGTLNLITIMILVFFIALIMKLLLYYLLKCEFNLLQFYKENTVTKREKVIEALGTGANKYGTKKKGVLCIDGQDPYTIFVDAEHDGVFVVSVRNGNTRSRKPRKGSK